MFLYLVRPNARLVWAGDSTAIQIYRELGRDLADLKWDTDTDQVLDDDKIRVALRHGEACRTGIVVDGLALRLLSRSDEIRALNRIR